MDINFELYKVFYHVASTMSFSAASERLYVSQSAVSQSIKTLEEKLQCSLFFRNTKKVRLTKEGEVLFKHVEQAYNFIKSGERTIEEMHSLNQGEIRIGASDTICKYYLMPYFKQFNSAYPNIRISVINRTSPKCIELLKNGSVDFSVINVPEKLSYSNMTIKKTRELRDIFIAGANYFDLRGKSMSLKELEKYPMLALEKNTITREYYDRLMELHGVDITPEVDLGSVDVLIDMARIGLGIAFVPEFCIKKEDSNEIFILNIKEKIPERYMGIVTLDNIPLSIAAQKFIEMLR
ncbi:MAG: LysR family transcriptional regulator [Bacillota bacterium]